MTRLRASRRRPLRYRGFLSFAPFAFAGAPAGKLCLPRSLAARSPPPLAPETALDLARSGAPDGAAAGRLAGLLIFGADGDAWPRSDALERAALADGLDSGRLTLGAAGFAAGCAAAFAAGAAVVALLFAAAPVAWPPA